MKPHILRRFPDVVILDGDELRKEHPDYRNIIATDPDNMPAQTQQFVYNMLVALKDYAHRNKRSYALETTFHDGTKTETTFAEAKENGFKTELHILAVSPEISYLSTILRFERGTLEGSIGRRVAKGEHFDRAGKNVEALRYCVTNKVADHIILYRREVVGGQPKVVWWKRNPFDPVQDFLDERSRILTPGETECYANVVHSILKMMKARKAGPAEITGFQADFSAFLRT